MLNLLHPMWIYSHIPNSSSKLQFQLDKFPRLLDPLAVAKGHAYNQIGSGGDYTRFQWGERDTSQPTYRYSILWRHQYVDDIKIYFRHKTDVNQ